MPQKDDHTRLDEQEIAQLLAGSLGEDARVSLLTRLAADPDARELLAMALEALQAAEEISLSKPGDGHETGRAA